MSAPAKAPCVSCPYRRDVPAGVWAAEEYDKLLQFDGPTAYQSPTVFYCHQQDGRVCAGWAGTHDMEESLGLRMGVMLGVVSPEDAEAIRAYESPVPLFSSGREAAEHGRAGIEEPDVPARQMVERISRKRTK